MLSMWFYYRWYVLKLKFMILLLIVCTFILAKYWYILIPLSIIACIKLDKVVKENEEKLNAPAKAIMNEVDEIRGKLFKLKRQYDEATTYEDRDFYRNCALDCRPRLYELRRQAMGIEQGSLKMHVKIKTVGDIDRLDKSISTDFYGRK